jgi:hypothetical protein
MTDRELKKFALVGMLIRIQADTDKLKRVKAEEQKERLKKNIDNLTTEYNNLLKELKEKPLF